MRKSLFAILLVSSLCVSCVIKEGTNSYVEVQIGYFTDGLVQDMVMDPLSLLLQCDEADNQDIFAPGFNYQYDGIVVSLLSAADSTWTATNASDFTYLSFKTSIKMLPDNILGLHQWRLTSEGLYEENSYKAAVTTETPAVFSWTDRCTPSSYNYELTFDGKFKAVTYQEGKALDECILTYKSRSLDSYFGDYTTQFRSLRQ